MSTRGVGKIPGEANACSILPLRSGPVHRWDARRCVPKRRVTKQLDIYSDWHQRRHDQQVEIIWIWWPYSVLRNDPTYVAHVPLDFRSCVREMPDGFEHHQHRCIIAGYEMLRSPALQVQTTKSKRKKPNLRHVDVACGALVELVHMMSFQSQGLRQSQCNIVFGMTVYLRTFLVRVVIALLKFSSFCWLLHHQTAQIVFSDIAFR